MIPFWKRCNYRCLLSIQSLPKQNQRNSVSTSSSLITVFNTKPSTHFNFKFSKNVGLFGLENLKTFDGFYLMKEDAKILADNLINEAVSPYRKRKVVDIFDELSDTLCRVADLAEFIRVAHPDSNFAAAAEDACITISGLVEKLNTHKELYDVLKSTCMNGDIVKTSSVENHVANLFLFDFEQCGIQLGKNERHEVVGLNNLILQIGQRFMAGCHDSRAIKKDLLPSSLQSFFTLDNNLLVVNNLHSDSDIESVREICYRVYLLPAEQQQDLLNKMLESRHLLANTCGFPTYAHRALKSSLAGHPSMVKQFLDELNMNLRPFAEEELKELLKIKQQKESGSKHVQPWDVPYLSAKYKKIMSQASASDYMPYFSLGACMDSLNALFNDLYGVSLVNRTIEHGEVWSPDVYKLDVVHEKEGILGHIYCDFYERTGKPNQDCHFTIRCGRLLPDGSYQMPIVVVMLNLASPSWGSPCLLTPAMLENLYHEMGHAMHSMLGRTAHQHVSGTRTSTDFAELPSILMEYFVSHPTTLGRIGKHYLTGEKMPEALLGKLIARKKLLTATDMSQQIFYSALDQRLHGLRPLPGGTTQSTTEQLQNEYYPLPYVANTSWELRFSHLVGYGAKYYSYLMSRAVASWVWKDVFSKDPLSRDAGERYRREVLAYGGSKPPALLLKDLLHKEVTPSALANALISEIPAQRS